jgi:hypothetical protein
MAAVHVADTAAFTTKLGLALQMIHRAVAAGALFAWMAASRWGYGAPVRAMCWV